MDLNPDDPPTSFWRPIQFWKKIHFEKRSLLPAGDPSRPWLALLRSDPSPLPSHRHPPDHNHHHHHHPDQHHPLLFSTTIIIILEICMTIIATTIIVMTIKIECLGVHLNISPRDVALSIHNILLNHNQVGCNIS